MNKNEKQILGFIILLFIGINYVLYTYYLNPKINIMNNKIEEYNKKTQQLSMIKVGEVTIEMQKKVLASSEKEVSQLDKLTVKEINTPQLIYDFYMGCKKYKIKGEDVVFQLNQENPESSKQPNASLPSAALNGVTSTQGIASNSVTPVSPGVGDENSNISETSKNSIKLVKLSINLNVKGNKHNIINFINNLGNITTRLLNVTNIKIDTSVTDSNTGVVNSNNINTAINKNENQLLGDIPGEILNNTTSQGIASNGGQNNNTTNNSQTVIEIGDVSASIQFNQYLLMDGKEYNNVHSYKFYNSKIGFSNIEDMFK
jgi:type IV pilus assembly protein PilO